jgi:hypothetical protein
MIEKINLRILRNAEFLQFLKLTIKAVTDTGAEQLNVAAVLAALENEYNASDALFVLPQNSKMTPKIVALDNRRDEVLGGMMQIINGNLNHWEVQYVEAATALTANIKLYGKDINSMNYQAQTSTVASMTKDWVEKTELAEAVTLLGLTAWKDELIKSNTEFTEIYSNRTKELGAKDVDTFKLRRAEGLEAYRKLTNRLSAFATLDEVGTYKNIINELNALVAQYNTLLAMRNGNRNAGTQSEEPQA